MPNQPAPPRGAAQRSRRIFLGVAGAHTAAALAWAATGTPFPGAVTPARPEDLVDPAHITGVYGVLPTSIAVERLDAVALSRDWTGITARYNNTDGTVQIFAFVGNTPLEPPPPGAVTDPDTGLIRTQDSAGTHGLATHWTLPGRRYAGVALWATEPPDDAAEYLVALRRHATR